MIKIIIGAESKDLPPIDVKARQWDPTGTKMEFVKKSMDVSSAVEEVF